MTQVSVYGFRYDITTDDYVTSTRMATHEKAAQICAEIIPGTKREIDASLRNDGWTEKNFDRSAAQN